MHDRELYAKVLGIESPWKVTDVELELSEGEVRVLVSYSESAKLLCPQCHKRGKRHDSRRRGWRHLDTCQYRTILSAEVPRVRCVEHGVHQIEVPWAEPNSRFTALFEAIVIDWLMEASIIAVSRQMQLTWDEAAGIQERAVARGLRRKGPKKIRAVGIDETSFRRRHKYVTVITDLDEGLVDSVAEGRSTSVVEEYFTGLSEEQLEAIEVVCMDMWKAYITATTRHVPNADQKIAFDKFHVAKHLGDAVDKVRRQEHRDYLAEGNEALKGSKYFWLQNPANMDRTRREFLEILQRVCLKTSRAWAIKEMAMGLWHYGSRTWAAKAWKRWLAWAARCRLEPMRKVARMIRDHLWGIINAIVLRATNAGSEAMNARIQKIKKLACGFRNPQRFRAAIYFHLGGLDLYPRGVNSLHTNS